MTPQDIEFLFRHIVLPTKLPGQIEEDRKERELCLLQLLRSAVVDFKQGLGRSRAVTWARIEKSLVWWEKIRGSDHKFSRKSLVKVLDSLQDGDLLVLCFDALKTTVTFQCDTAGVLIHCFSSAPPEEQVMSNTFVLMQFPTQAVRMDWTEFKHPRFTKQLSLFLERLDRESSTTKGMSKPELLTEFLMSLLLAYGHPVSSLRAVIKKVRDTLSTYDNKSIWRRSSCYLSLKATIQLQLFSCSDRDELRQYKNFMLCFFNALAEQFLELGVDSELLFLMNNKLARRVHKLGDSVLPSVAKSVQKTANQIARRLQAEWKKIREKSLVSFQTFDPAPDDETCLQLGSLLEYIDRATNRPTARPAQHAKEYERYGKIAVSSTELPGYEEVDAVQKNDYYALADFEYWVAKNLEAWTAEKLANCLDEDYRNLSLLIQSYICRGLVVYQNSVDQLSVLLLTALDLWVALDRLACAKHPFLQDFSPEIPKHVLTEILLNTEEDLRRLDRLEKWLHWRHDNLNYDKASVFSQPRHEWMKSLADSCYEDADEGIALQNLETSIKNDNNARHQKKLEEFESLRKELSQLQESHLSLSHSSAKTTHGYHKRVDCPKCEAQKKAKSLTIEVGEEILPANPHFMLFELQAPKALVFWRDATWAILNDIIKGEPKKGKQSLYHIQSAYEPLRSYWTEPRPRLQVMSLVAPAARQTLKVSEITEAETVWKQNSFSLVLLDTKTNVIVSDRSKVHESHLMFNLHLSLPEGPYSRSQLDEALRSAPPSTNTVIAHQNNCSNDLNLKEYVAFGSFRAGERLPWWKVLLELMAGTIDLNTKEASLLFKVATYQVGNPSDTYLRLPWHVFENTTLCERLFDAIRRHIPAAEENWTNVHLVKLLVDVTMRMTALCVSETEFTSMSELLQKLRAISLKWARELSKDDGCLNRRVGLVEKKKHSAARDFAFIYQISFEAEKTPGQDFDGIAFFECSRIIKNLMNQEGLDDELLEYVTRSARVGRHLESIIVRQALKYQSNLSRILSEECQLSAAIDCFEALNDDDDRAWIIGTSTQPTQEIRLNVLTGTVLINGYRTRQLPSNYTGDALYQRLFGDRLVDVLSSDEEGMAYMSRAPISGWRVYFSRNEELGLIVRMKREDQKFEIIPPSKLQEKFPAPLIDSYVHWLNMETKAVEFRPFDNFWQSSEENWSLMITSMGHGVMHKGSTGTRLYDMDKRSFTYLSTLFAGFEDKNNILVIRSDECLCEIVLPRYDLRFFINPDGNIICRELNSIIDFEYDIGVFYGLKSKIILKSLANSEDMRRKVLIPYGTVNVARNSDGVHVSVDITSKSSHCKYFEYSMDPILGRLVHGPDTVSRLFAAYLHAVTSYLLSDPLTRRSGTEEALRLLNQQSINDCVELTDEALAILDLISSLTPTRRCPGKNKIAETVIWNENLLSTTQITDFSILATRIKKENERLRSIYSSGPGVRNRNSPDSNSLSRANSMESRFNIFDHKIKLDYPSEPIPVFVDGSCLVHQLSTMVRTWRVPHQPSLLDLFNELETVHGFNEQFEYTSLSELSKLPIQTYWGSLFEVCFRSSESDCFDLIFLFGPLVFFQPELMQHAVALIACAIKKPQYKPRYSCYNLSLGMEVDADYIKTVLTKNRIPFEESARRSNHPAGRLFKKKDYDFAFQTEHIAIHNLVKEKWDSGDLGPAPGSFNCIDVQGAMSLLKKRCRDWRHNKQFHQFVRHLNNTVFREATFSLEHIITPSLGVDARFDQWTETESKLPDLLELLKSTKETVSSIDLQSFTIINHDNISTQDHLRQVTDEQYAVVEKFETSMRNVCKAHTTAQFILKDARLFPNISKFLLLGLMARSTWSLVPPQWKAAILHLGKTIAQFQHFQRLAFYAIQGDGLSLQRELSNIGYINWSPEEYPEWLLFQLENNVFIRDTQALLAKEIISPTSNESSIFQLNMGEGKSSIIIPIVSTTLANGESLFRVIVLKPLVRQMIRALQEKLGGLIDRRVYYLPFQRNMKLDVKMLTTFFSLMEECLQTGGILVCLPEHILSMKLVGIDLLMQKADASQLQEQKALFHRISELASQVVLRQEWLSKHARDVLDESDEILSPNFELVYTSGARQPVDYAPDRWILASELLGVIAKNMDSFTAGLPIDLVRKPGEQWSDFHILTPEAADKFVSSIGNSISDGFLPSLPLCHCSSGLREAIADYLVTENCRIESRKAINANFEGSDTLRLLATLRGFLAGGILKTVFYIKRWYVDYGLDSKRAFQMAVPYRAKGVPSLSSEYSNPDIAIILTYLSWYNTGLDEDTTLQTLKLLQQDPDGDSLYRRWTPPSHLLDLRRINTIDTENFATNIFPYLRYNTSTINYFLSKKVFPRDCREYTEKLSSSAWDLPFDTNQHTTGFSGTSSSADLLPLSIKQQQLAVPESNAEDILARIKNAANAVYELPGPSNDPKQGLKQMLEFVISKENLTKVLIDVGALIVGVTNQDVIETWMGLDGSIAGGIFFDNGDDLKVRYQDGRVERLVGSLFNQQLEKCVIYLDEAHTRGTDIAFPCDFRGAVTLGPFLTKERFSQGCLRLRKLGFGQQFICICPHHIHKKLEDLAKERNSDTPNIDDVFALTERESRDYVTRNTLLNVTKGLDHCRRRLVHQKSMGNRSITGFLENIRAVRKFAQIIPGCEKKTVIERYSQPSKAQEEILLGIPQSDIRRDNTLARLVNTYYSLRDKEQTFVGNLEEREREAFHQAEEERLAYRPPNAEPAGFEICGALKYFVAHGKLNHNNDKIHQAFLSLLHGSRKVGTWPNFFARNGRKSRLFVTTSYKKSIVPAKEDLNLPTGHDFLRPVNWVLSSNCSPEAGLLVISAEEANAILPDVIHSKAVTLHLYSPRMSLSMPSFNKLDVCNIPSDTTPILQPTDLIELGLFAGSLYLDSYQDYMLLCEYLGLAAGYPGVIPNGVTVSVDGYIPANNRAGMGWGGCPFGTNPLPMIQTLVTGRCKGEVFRDSHIGQVLRGRTLTESDFDQQQTMPMDIDKPEDLPLVEENNSSEQPSEMRVGLAADFGYDSDEIM